MTFIHETPAPGYEGITYVIPCGGAKVGHAAPAGGLYTGSMFRFTLDKVSALAASDVRDGVAPAARVLILSALHGLVELDTVLEPYDLKMGAPGSVTAETVAAQALALGIDWGSQVCAFLPQAYFEVLDEAMRSLYVYVLDVFEELRDLGPAGGIGAQKRLIALACRPDVPADVDDGPGPTVWIGGDVGAFWWGTPILVSYGRLREAKSLPVATAPWVCDSRGFAEINQHGRWTIPAAVYAADVDRYAREIGRLEWVAPQDWPAGAASLAKTGLTEAEHQRRTIESVLELRPMLPHRKVICVVTGKDAEGYLRHIDMYAAHGIDLRAEQLVVGVGALVGRPVHEAADIIRVLHAAGLKRLHGFGVKGLVLDLVGGLLESIDSASWARAGQKRGGLCVHGLVKHEQNCPAYARQWARRERLRAVAAVVQEALPLFIAG